MWEEGSLDLVNNSSHGKWVCGGVCVGNYKILRLVGRGEMGRVYVCRRITDDQEFAIKVVKKEVLEKAGLKRCEMEKRILKMVRHPFLPTLHAHFEDQHISCVVIDFCSGGDLHTLRHAQPHKRFSLNSARFYAAEVVIALEYLHMLGVLYRDLKPENILLKSDGHIMLSDFDLSFISHSTPTLHSSIPHHQTHRRKTHPCFPLLSSSRVRTLNCNTMFVAEPVSARSRSLVGTHEYVAPEIALGSPHGSSVDWWALGIFLHEMIYGRTPFLGESNDATLRNIVARPLAFEREEVSCEVEMHARDLIAGLLVKDPGERIGSRFGSGEVKSHSFFKGVNFALIRCMKAPVVPERKKGKTAAFEYF